MLDALDPLRRRLLPAADGPNERDPAFIRRFLAMAGPYLIRHHDAEIQGLEHLPDEPALFVGNHNAPFWSPDTYIAGWCILERQGLARVPFALGHRMLFEVPGLAQVLTRLGAVTASPQTASALFAAGHSAVVYPGGDVDISRPSRHRHLFFTHLRRGYARLAIRCGVPIVPIASVGAHDSAYVISDMRWLARGLGLRRFGLNALPLTLSMPLGVTLGPTPHWGWPSKVRMAFLPPVRFSRAGEAAAADSAYVWACANEVEGAIQQTMTRLADGLPR